MFLSDSNVLKVPIYSALRPFLFSEHLLSTRAWDGETEGERGRGEDREGTGQDSSGSWRPWGELGLLPQGGERP